MPRAAAHRRGVVTALPSSSRPINIKLATSVPVVPSAPRSCRFATQGGNVSTRPRLQVHAAGGDEHWMDFLKFDGQPSFDVLAKTQEYVDAPTEGKSPYWADDYIFRGSVIGPITGKDVQETQSNFSILDAYPDLNVDYFGFTIDPENPYRCLFFERWTGTNTGELKVAGQGIPPTGKKVKVPTHVTSVTWNPQGKVVYSSVSPPLDRFEGNTKGQGAVFGLLAFAGLPVGGGVGDVPLMIQQKANMAFGGAIGKTWSFEWDIPEWWKSKARGADPNDM